MHTRDAPRSAPRHAPCATHQERIDLHEWLCEHEGAGLVYCGRRQTCDELAGALAEAGVDAVAYHAGKDAATRSRLQRGFCGGDTRVMVATVPTHDRVHDGVHDGLHDAICTMHCMWCTASHGAVHGLTTREQPSSAGGLWHGDRQGGCAVGGALGPAAEPRAPLAGGGAGGARRLARQVAHVRHCSASGALARCAACMRALHVPPADLAHTSAPRTHNCPTLRVTSPHLTFPYLTATSPSGGGHASSRGRARRAPMPPRPSR